VLRAVNGSGRRHRASASSDRGRNVLEDNPPLGRRLRGTKCELVDDLRAHVLPRRLRYAHRGDPTGTTLSVSQSSCRGAARAGLATGGRCRARTRSPRARRGRRSVAAHPAPEAPAAAGAIGGFYRFRDRKRWQEFLGFLRQLRARFPTGRLYVVCDNFSPHRTAGHRLVRRPRCRVGVHPEQRVLAELDRVRVHCAALLHPRWQRLPLPCRQETAIAGYVRWANKRARPKQRFALNSKTRLPAQRCLMQH
jgi:hypothetical protein